MNVRVFPADTHGCSYYRLEEPARVLEDELDIDVFHGEWTLYYAPQQKQRILCTVHREDRGGVQGSRLNELRQDVAVFTRPARRGVVEAIEALQARGSAVVVDVDDDPGVLPTTHVAYDDFRPAVSPDRNHLWLRKAAGIADMVTTTNQVLAERFAPHGRVAILPNRVPRALLEMPRRAGRTLGWAGDIKTHPGDLHVPAGGVAGALARTGWRFHIVGSESLLVQKALGLFQEPTETGWLSVADWHLRLGELDVGIVPLVDSAFTRAKSNLKGLEYAARGIPFVASPLPEYERLAGEGAGLLADERGRTWRRLLVQLMDDESLRWEMAERGRALVAERHTIEANGWRWAEAWKAAYDHAQARLRRPTRPTRPRAAV